MEQTLERRATGVETPVLGMAVFLMVEAMFFAGLVSAVVVGRVASNRHGQPGKASLLVAGGWPPAGQTKASPSAALAAAVLLLAGAASLRGKSAAPGRAAVIGLAFLVVQAAVAVRLLGGLHLPTNTYAGLVLAVLGMHALHVLGGVVALPRGNEEGSSRLRVCSMYWTFLAGVWPVIALAVCV